MAQKYDRRRYGYTDGSLAYDLDALARERALEEAGRVEEERREPAAAPRRRPVARPVAKLSPLVLACAVVVLRTMLDDTYKSADDIRKYTGMVVLASIPLADAGEQPKEKSEFKRRSKRFADDVRRRVGGSSGRKA